MSIWTQSEIPCMPVHGISFWAVFMIPRMQHVRSALYRAVFAVRTFAFKSFVLETCKSLHE